MNLQNLSVEELRKILGPTRRKLEGQEYEEIRLILALLEPQSSGYSLHCWDSTYFYNGKFYEMSGELANPNALPIIEELNDV